MREEVQSLYLRAGFYTNAMCNVRSEPGRTLACILPEGWPYPAMASELHDVVRSERCPWCVKDWSPPVRNLSAFDAVVPTPLTLVPTEPAEPQVVTVEVPDVVDQEDVRSR